MSGSIISPISKKNIAGVVVLFNPEIAVIKNISSYIHEVDHIFIVDNSEKTNQHVLVLLKSTFPDMTYIPNQENVGIAKALNIGAFAALSNGYRWLLTMDQDSIADQQMIKHLIDSINHLPDIPIGIVAPYYVDKNTDTSKSSPAIQEILTVMTSGNLLNLEAFNKIGAFDEKLFIDYVDHEYCLRLRRKHYKIFQINSALLFHNLGNISSYQIGNKKIFYSNHNALRRYYITRNRLYVMELYKDDFPEFFKHEFLGIWKEFFKIILFEDDKFKKLKYIIKGFTHYKRRRFGKL